MVAYIDCIHRLIQTYKAIKIWRNSDTEAVSCLFQFGQVPGGVNQGIRALGRKSHTE